MKGLDSQARRLVRAWIATAVAWSAIAALVGCPGRDTPPPLTPALEPDTPAPVEPQTTPTYPDPDAPDAGVVPAPPEPEPETPTSPEGGSPDRQGGSEPPDGTAGGDTHSDPMR